VRIAMDDFGTGCSSYLQDFPFGKIKIGRSFPMGRNQAPDFLI
jgi:EAL domain-containing protein (putative c-di-GMP-specific phosphodiesterase class I)